MIEQAKRVQVKKNLFKTVRVESGETVWSKEDGDKREEIINAVGKEYNQINTIAEVLAEMVKEFPQLAENKVIADGLIEFRTIAEIRAR